MSYNFGSEALEISGWYLLTPVEGTEVDLWYQIPDALPPVPPGAYVVVWFDALDSDSDDYDFGDGVASLHSLWGLQHILGDEAGQVAFYWGHLVPPRYAYLPAVMRSYVSWYPVVPGPPPLPPESPLVDFVAWGAPPSSSATRPRRTRRSGIAHPAAED